jgi:hypothetical protein
VAGRDEPHQPIEDYAQKMSVREFLWKRLLRDTLHAIPARPLVAGRLRIEADQLLREGLEQSFESGIAEEQFYTVIVAVLRGTWPKWVGDWLPKQILDTHSEEKWRKIALHIPQGLRDSLPSGLLAAIL